MRIDSHLRKIERNFLILGAILILLVGGASLYWGEEISHGKLAIAAPVKTSELDSELKTLQQQGAVAGVSVTAATSNVTASSVPVLVYHGIVSNPDGINVSYPEFLAQMKALKAAGWQTVTIADFWAFIQGKKTLPPKSFLLTFDDGRKDSFYAADPVLQYLDYHAVMFVITGDSLVDPGNYYLNQSELEYMRNSGRWDLESHAQIGHDPVVIDSKGTTGDFLSNLLWLKPGNNPDKLSITTPRMETESEYEARVEKEISGVKQDLETKLDVQPIAMAYPFGDFGDDSVNNTANAEKVVLKDSAENYNLAFYQVLASMPFSQNYPEDSSNFYLAKRITVTADLTPSTLLDAISAGSGITLPYQENFSNPDAWVATWGQVAVANSSVSLTAKSDGTGGSVYLDGGRKLSNYTMTANAELVAGTSFSLVADYQDDNNYLSCNYSSGGVTLEQTLNGQTQQLAAWWVKLPVDQRTVNAGIYSANGLTQCLLNGRPMISTARASSTLNSGSIGFKVWSAQNGQAALKVTAVGVSGT